MAEKVTLVTVYCRRMMASSRTIAEVFADCDLTETFKSAKDKPEKFWVSLPLTEKQISTLQKSDLVSVQDYRPPQI